MSRGSTLSPARPGRRREALRFEPLLARRQRQTLRAAHLGADRGDALLVGLAQHEGHRQTLVCLVVGEPPVHGESHVDVFEDHELAVPLPQGVHAPMLAGRLGRALHHPGGERKVVALLRVPADRRARRGDVDLEQDRYVVLALRQAEQIDAGGARQRVGQLLGAAEQVVAHGVPRSPGTASGNRSTTEVSTCRSGICQ